MLFVDGRHVRLVARRPSKALYWMSNTLVDSISHPHMLALGRSALRA
jgi:hypothetical protein